MLYSLHAAWTSPGVWFMIPVITTTSWPHAAHQPPDMLHCPSLNWGLCCPYANLKGTATLFWLSWVCAPSQKAPRVHFLAGLSALPLAFPPHQALLQVSSQNFLGDSFSTLKQPFPIKTRARRLYFFFPEMLRKLASQCLVSTCSAAGLPVGPVEARLAVVNFGLIPKSSPRKWYWLMRDFVRQ